MIDKEEAQRLRDEGKTLAEIGQLLGCTRERVRQVTKPPQDKFCVACGNRRYKLDNGFCSHCRKDLLGIGRRKNRLPCEWCGEPGGFKVAACNKHRGLWYYRESPYRRVRMLVANQKWQMEHPEAYKKINVRAQKKWRSKPEVAEKIRARRRARRKTMTQDQREKERAWARVYYRKRYANDEEYRAQKRANNRANYLRKKENATRATEES